MKEDKLNREIARLQAELEDAENWIERYKRRGNGWRTEAQLAAKPKNTEPNIPPKEPTCVDLNYDCTLAKFAEQIGIKLWQAMCLMKFAEHKLLKNVSVERIDRVLEKEGHLVDWGYKDKNHIDHAHYENERRRLATKLNRAILGGKG